MRLDKGYLLVPKTQNVKKTSYPFLPLDGRHSTSQHVLFIPDDAAQLTDNCTQIQAVILTGFVG